MTSRAEQIRSEQSRAEKSREEQSRSDQIRSDRITSDHIRSHQITSDQIGSDQIRAEQRRAGQSRAEQGRAEQSTALTSSHTLPSGAFLSASVWTFGFFCRFCSKTFQYLPGREGVDWESIEEGKAAEGGRDRTGIGRFGSEVWGWFRKSHKASWVERGHFMT